jgi:hypothetical protein
VLHFDVIKKGMNILLKNNAQKLPFFVFLVAVCISSCKKFVAVDTPRTDLIKETVFESDEAAVAALRNIYYQMGETGYASANSVSYLTSLSSDESVCNNTSAQDGQLKQFDVNHILPNAPLILTLWSEPYKAIYNANAILEGIASSSKITPALKKQLEGEALFLRAFNYFYLVNLFGGVPLVLTTDYRVNSTIEKSDSLLVYNQVINDLLLAQQLLGDSYQEAFKERVRADYGAATALLGRVYLYLHDWEKAETQATVVIDATDNYALDSNLNKVFLRSSKEAIWQVSHDLSNTRYRGDFDDFSISSLSGDLINKFEPGDDRTGYSYRRSILSIMRGITQIWVSSLLETHLQRVLYFRSCCWTRLKIGIKYFTYSATQRINGSCILGDDCWR